MEGSKVYQASEIGEPIDIILLTHGRLDLTVPCVQSIYANTKSLFHLIVVDDSTPEMDKTKMKTRDWFRKIQIENKNITFIHSDEPYKSGNQAFNIGLAHGSNRFVATVMNSIRVEPDWEIVPIGMMTGNPKIGIIGMKCLKLGWSKEQDGQIESAGIGINGYVPVDMGRNESAHRLCVSYPCYSLQWAFALVRREAAVGNLDENLWKGFVGWDDIDNTLVLRSKGWEAWYCGLSSGYHVTHATRGTDADEAIMNNRINAEIFFKRWGYWDMFRSRNPYAPEYFPNGEVKFICNANEMPLRVGDGT